MNIRKFSYSIIFLFFLFMYLYMIIFSRSGIIIQRETLNEIRELKIEIAKLEADNRKFEKEIVKLKTDEYIIEEAKNLDMIQSGEKVLKFTDPNVQDKRVFETVPEDDKERNVFQYLYQYRALEIILFLILVALFLYYFKGQKKTKQKNEPDSLRY
ncbi:MAG: septum formation initiator family protein [Actinomycetia bacterium]|nr:septum formation initiator family protein [Actinomycetes bacterium]